MNALGGKKEKKVKKEEGDEGDEETKVKKAAKKKKTLGSTQTSFKKPVQDTMTRFFNSYGESPHL